MGDTQEFLSNSDPLYLIVYKIWCVWVLLSLLALWQHLITIEICAKIHICACKCLTCCIPNCPHQCSKLIHTHMLDLPHSHLTHFLESYLVV